MAQPLSLLLVVAEEQSRSSVVQLLRSQSGWAVTAVTNSAEAIVQLKSKAFELVISEIEIGSIDGWRLARLLRSNVLQSAASTPFILLSSTYCERITETTARAYGIDLVLPLDQYQKLPDYLQQHAEYPINHQKKPELLLVEDDPDIAELARRILQPFYKITLASTGFEAVELYKPDTYTLVLLDVMLPGMTGQQVLQHIMAIQKSQSVVVMTAHAGVELAEEMLLQGAADFISKPFRADQLRKVMEVAAQREDFMVSNQQFGHKVQALASSESRYKALSMTHQRVLDHVSTVVMELDNRGQIQFANKAWSRFAGSAGLNFPMSHYLADQDKLLWQQQLNFLFSGRKSHWRHELQLFDYQGELHWVIADLTLLSGEGKAGLTVTLENIDERKKAEQELKHLALHDTLTGLYNRYFFDQELNRLAVSARKNQEQHALLYLDLDHFKVINDSQGHSQGDAILREVASLLSAGLGKDDVLCRVGGDEFALLLTHCELSSAEQLAQRLCASLQQGHYRIADRVYKISCSIGLSKIDGSASEAQQYLQQADIALYVAKRKGRNLVHCYTDDDQDSGELQLSLQWSHQLQEAIVNDQITLHFQPIVKVSNGAVAYFEALVRLQLDDRLVYPGEFIPALERAEDINLLDHQVISKAIAMMHQYPQLHKVAINLSAQAFSDARLLPLIKQKLEQYQVDATRIIFELTESASLSNIQATRLMIESLTQLGCEFSIDDFGTGFSTFSYLKQLPAHSIKIDGSFVREMDVDQIDYALVKSIAEIARVLNRKSVAEFVENERIFDLLKELGVDYAQGYHISKPMDIENVKKYILETIT
ncbi:MAG: EAL domain-containing protein [Gammaproteobacteria bacterium]|nr:EAL domain-containing protein [Gammaproteobacteria bacterium]MBU2056614.1 EAL domain-containing protein [Gammaproteobacteria bacterium]MBU2173951.1 EAL domain-containing protein [Gammaproteobacteria bacterium]MBU2247257.1 EAL domain-containing protein [Gammaproteobacteria bacterium]MBU2344915.1 EAL domain-containing protein [Gammaproteobacteria bacterium]